MKVLVVSHSYAAAENQKNIAALQRHADVRVAVPHVIEDRVIGEVKPQGTPEDTYLVRRRLSLPRNQYLLASGDLGMRAFKPDIVHIEYDPWTPIFWQTCLARARHAPGAQIVCTVKKNTLRQLPQPLQAAKVGVARAMLGRVAHVIAINEGVGRIYRTAFGVPPAKITLMQHLGIDPATFRPGAVRAPGEPLIVGYCGRIDANKGIEDLLAALTAVLEDRPGSARLRIIGNGALRDDLVRRRLPWLEILPPVAHAQVADFMRGLDLFVMPALVTPDHEEHDGHALMEAMACGVASIASTSGILPELLAEGCGEIYEAGNAAALAEKLRLLAGSPGQRAELARRALARVSRDFTIEAIAARKSDLYAKVLHS